MEREDLIRHLAGWRDGVDPATGALLPPDHPAQRPDFLRVVCAAIDALAARAPAEGGGPPARPQGSSPPKAGRPWTPAEDALLASGLPNIVFAGLKADSDSVGTM